MWKNKFIFIIILLEKKRKSILIKMKKIIKNQKNKRYFLNKIKKVF